MTDDGLVGRLDRLGVERMAMAGGLPAPIAARIADVIVAADLPVDRRGEVFRELVAHFEDGLAAGRSVDELLAAFGDGSDAGAAIRRAKRIVTPEASGGTGPRDGFLVRLWRDARYATRRLRARPAFALAAVLSLALGIGSNTAIFTLVNGLILRKPPLANASELVDVYRSDERSPFDPVSYPDVLDLGRLPVFQGVAGARLGILSRLDGGVPERVGTQLVTGNFFAVLGVRPELGRTIRPDDASAPGEGAVAMLSHRYWQRAFGGDPGVVGRTIRLTGGEFTIIGVVDRRYQGMLPGISIDLYVPFTMAPRLVPGGVDELTVRTNQSTFVKARLAPGVTMPRVRTELANLAAELRAQRLPGWEGTGTLTALPTAEVLLYPPIDEVIGPVAAMLMIVVGLVLVIACANLAGFLLARAIDRRKEIAVRLALGASRGRLVGQLLIESTLLALVGGAVGLLLGRLAIGAVLGMDFPIPLPVTLDLTIDWRVLAFSVAVSIAAGVVFGLVPALQSTRLDLASVIRDETTGGGRSKGALRSALVVGQVAVAVVLLVAAGLFTRSLDAVRRIDPGFGRLEAEMVWVGVPATREPAEALQSIERLGRELALLPGARGVAIVENLHLNLLNYMSTRIVVDGVEPPPGETAFQIDHSTVDSGFIAVAGMTLRAGRNFTAFDRAGTTPVAIVNQAFAETFWPGRDPVGRRYRYEGGAEVEVVGVVNTAKIRSLAEPPRPFIYRPVSQDVPAATWLLVGKAGSAPAPGAVLDLIGRIDPDLLVLESRSMSRHIGAMSLPIRMAAGALGSFALLALVMASIGLYGTVSYAVAQRSREVGIRLALGADRGSVVTLLLWGGLRLVLLGAAVGLTLAVVFASSLQGLLFGIRAFDPVTLLVVPVVLVVIAGLAAWVPARRAGRVQPVVALRAEG